MNICFVTLDRLSEFSGGVEAVTVKLMRQFIADGHHVVHIYSHYFSNTPPEGIALRREYQLPDLCVDSLANIDFVSNVLKRETVQVVMNQAHISSYHRLFLQAKEKYPFKLVFSYHGDPMSPLKGLYDDFEILPVRCSSLAQQISKQLYSLIKFPISICLRYVNMRKKYRTYARECDAVVFLSEDYKEKVNSITNRRFDNLYSILNPFDQAPQITKKASHQVVFVGRLVFQKRLDRLLKAWKYVEEYVPDANLIIVGDGEASVCYKEYAQKLKLKNYSFVGAVPSITKISDSEVLCMTSTHEGFGLVVLEAMSCQTIPIVFNSISALKDLIRNGETGFLIASFSIRKYAEKIIEVLKNEELKNKIRVNLLNSRNENTSPNVAKKWYSLFEKLINLK